MLSNLQEAVDLRRIQREVSILSRLSNSTIIRLLEVVETRTHIYLVMELAQVGRTEENMEFSGVIKLDCRRLPSGLGRSPMEVHKLSFPPTAPRLLQRSCHARCSAPGD